MARPVSEYARKRNFDITSEPTETAKAKSKTAAHALSFVIHKHDARNLHYDFRLELEGTLKSWAVPKGPSLDPANKRLGARRGSPVELRRLRGEYSRRSIRCR